MSAEIVLLPSQLEAELHALREELSTLRSALAERESQIAETRIALKVFEARYMQQVGALYVELDEWDAKTYEREVDLYESEAARQRAAQSRKRADETREAAESAAAEPEEFEPSPDLKSLFREVAKRIHPDFARDDAEQQHFTRLMARANVAYNRGDTDTLQRLLDDQREISGNLGEESAAELVRLTRQKQQAQRDMAALEQEEQMLATNEIAGLKQEAETAEQQGRDLIAELAEGLREKIAASRYRFEFVDLQIKAQR